MSSLLALYGLESSQAERMSASVTFSPPATMSPVVEHVQCVVRRGLVALGRGGFEEIALELLMHTSVEIK